MMSIAPFSYPDDRTGKISANDIRLAGIHEGVFPNMKDGPNSVWLNLSTQLPYEGNSVRKWFSAQDYGLKTRKDMADEVQEAIKHHYSLRAEDMPLLRRIEL